MHAIKYYFGKLFQKVQVPTLKNCAIDSAAKICQRSNLINVTMGKYSYMGVANSLSNVKIGAFCSIASYCAIGGGSHPADFVSSSPIFLEGDNIFKKNFASFQFENSAEVVIGNDAWIGEGCFINGGVTVGNGAIIGAHSVVIKDVEPFSIVAGAPAKLIRYRFDKETIEELQKLHWWDWDETLLSRYANHFDDPASLLEAVKSSENFACR